MGLMRTQLLSRQHPCLSYGLIQRRCKIARTASGQADLSVLRHCCCCQACSSCWNSLCRHTSCSSNGSSS